MKKLIGQGAGKSQVIKVMLMMFFPSLAYYLKISFIPHDAQEFFVSLIKNSMKTRKESKTKLNDFIDFYIEMAKNLEKNNKVEEVEAESEFEKNAEVKGEAQAMTDEELETMVIANGLLVFFVGNDTSSTAMAIIMFWLANKQEVQDKLYEEIKVR